MALTRTLADAVVVMGPQEVRLGSRCRAGAIGREPRVTGGLRTSGRPRRAVADVTLTRRYARSRPW